MRNIINFRLKCTEIKQREKKKIEKIIKSKI